MKKMLAVVIIVIAAATFCCTGCMGQNDRATAIENLSVTEFKNRLSQDANVQLVDVRTPEEFAAGHIEGASNVNYLGADFQNQIQKLDKNRPVMIYCKSGVRSNKAAAVMEKVGFTTVYNLNGGYLNWIND